MVLLDELNRLGVIAIKSLQISFPEGDTFFLGVTQVADPLYAFTILFPLVAALNTELATDVLVSTVVAEWSNTLLKWLLMEDRPYWWVKETSLYESSFLMKKAPILRQTSLTCETGPGSPSGHVMGAAAVSFVLCQWFIRNLVYGRNQPSEMVAQLVSWIVWAAYVAALVLISLSRMYVATHFPHQCLLGAVGGVIVAWMFSKHDSPVTKWWKSTSRLRLMAAAAAVCVISLAAYWLQRALGVDPQWSVRLAFKWCESPDFLYVNTTPLFSLVRVCGAAFGVALSAHCRPRNLKPNIIVGLVGCISLAVAFQFATSAVPTRDVRVFYICQFLLHVTQPYFLLVLIPKLGTILKFKRD